MRNRGKFKVLFFSISILLLLVLVYYSKAGVKKENDGTSWATAIMNAGDKISTFVSDAMEKRKAKAEEKDSTEKNENHLVNAETSDKEFDESEKPEDIAQKEDVEETVNDELSEEIPDEPVYSEFVKPYEILIPEDLKIPVQIGDIEFRSTNEYVYSCDDGVNLYDTPILEGEPSMTASLYDEFLRVGISEDCCYQLISKEGSLYYSDGTHFLRHREDMALTENISLGKDKVNLPVEYISQFPTLPKGAEITSLTMAMNAIGIEASKDDLAGNFLKKGKASASNYYEEFLGSPDSRNAYGCFAPVIVDAANAYLESIESDIKAVDYTDSSFSDLLLKVKEGHPVIVWIAENLEEEPEFVSEWICRGEYLRWKDNMHCVLVTGYDMENKTVLYMDPMKGFKEADMPLFVKRYKQFYSQAVILEKQEVSADN